jgi:predicted amidohydrolase YtcJ
VAGTGWVRGVGWSGHGDRHDLDRVAPDRPVRVQHRSGALWTVNSVGVRELELDSVDHPGVERDAGGRPTGRLWRMDAWLGQRLGRELPDLESLGRSLAGLGITGVADASPDLDRATCELLRGGVPQHLLLLGDPDGDGPFKLVLPDHDLPPLGDLVARLRELRPRPVAVHCVSREALVLLLAAWEEVGRVPVDRVEHAALVPPELAGTLGAAVVTQPGFVLARGDGYLRDVAARDHPDLYRYASLLRAGVAVVPSSDAPYGPVDPWCVLRAARDRRTRSGRDLGAAEAVSTAQALAGMLKPLDALSAPPRRVVAGATADLVLLHTSLEEGLAAPDAALVRTTWIRGERVHGHD